MKRLWTAWLMWALLPACGDGPVEAANDSEETDNDAGDGKIEDAGAETDTGEPTLLEIAGTYTTEWGQTITVSESEWTDESEWGTFNFAIASYNNEKKYLVAQDGEDDTWNRFEWTFSSETLYYCQTVFGEEEEADADVAENLADADDLGAGCGGYPWSSLTPAE